MYVSLEKLIKDSYEDAVEFERSGGKLNTSFYGITEQCLSEIKDAKDAYNEEDFLTAIDKLCDAVSCVFVALYPLCEKTNVSPLNSLLMNIDKHKTQLLKIK